MRVLSLILVACLSLGTGCLSADVVATERLTYAQALVWGSPFPVLVVHVWHPDGTNPDQAAIETMMAALEEETDKSSIRLEGPNPYPTSDVDGNAPQRWSLQSLVRWAEAYSHPPQDVTNQTAHLNIFYLRGSVDEAYEGFSMGGTIFIFPEEFRSVQLDTPSEYAAAVVERAVLVHEVGHSMGLVNNGAPMTVARDDGTQHSTNEGSVMHQRDGSTFASVQENAIANSAIPYRYDAADKADLAAFRELGRQRAASAG